jgi:hypothetical protein
MSKGEQGDEVTSKFIALDFKPKSEFHKHWLHFPKRLMVVYITINKVI